MLKRLGFHNVSDDSVSSVLVAENVEKDATIAELMSNPTIDHMWTRDHNGNVDWQWERLSVTVSITRERITLSDFPYVGWVTRKN